MGRRGASPCLLVYTLLSQKKRPCPPVPVMPSCLDAQVTLQVWALLLCSAQDLVDESHLECCNHGRALMH